MPGHRGGQKHPGDGEARATASRAVTAAAARAHRPAPARRPPDTRHPARRSSGPGAPGHGVRRRCGRRRGEQRPVEDLRPAGRCRGTREGRGDRPSDRLHARHPHRGGTTAPGRVPHTGDRLPHHHLPEGGVQAGLAGLRRRVRGARTWSARAGSSARRSRRCWRSSGPSPAEPFSSCGAWARPLPRARRSGSPTPHSRTDAFLPNDASGIRNAARPGCCRCSRRPLPHRGTAIATSRSYAHTCG